MRKRILLILPALVAACHAGWFSNDKATELEREQRTQAEHRLENAQKRIETQQDRIERLHGVSSFIAAIAVVLLIVGMALGSKTKRDGTRK